MPLRTEYSCRLREPKEFQKKSFRRISSGDVDLIIARPHGMKKTRAQAIRYPRELWDEKDAKRSCRKRQGTFEPVGLRPVDLEGKLGQIPPFLLKKQARSRRPGGRKTKTKPRPLPPDAQNVQTLPFDSELFDCYGKQTKRGFRAYCRRRK